MGDWRYFAERLDGNGLGTVIDVDLPLSEVEIEDNLSAPSALTGTISPEFKRLRDPKTGVPILEEWGTAIYAESEGVIRGGGILQTSSFNGSDWELECVGWPGYFKDMPYAGNGIHFEETDTLDIVRWIITHIQSQPGSNIGLQVDQRKSGRLVGKRLAQSQYDPAGNGNLTLESQSYKIAFYESHDLLANIDGLAELTPFDYHERHYWEGDKVAHFLDFGVPIIGSKRNDLRFVVGENIFVNPDIDMLGDLYASEVIALGAGEGSQTKRGDAKRSRGTRLRRVAVVSDPSQNTAAKVTAYANRELKWRSTLEDVSQVEVRNHPHAPIGSIGVGDVIHIEGETGWVTLDADYRVLGIVISPDDSDSMTLNIARTDRVAA